MRKTKPLVFTHRLCIILIIVALLLSVVGVKATETFSGRGNDVTKVFELKEGVAIFDFERGKGDFFVSLYNAETGSHEKYLVTKSIIPEIEKKKKVFLVNNKETNPFTLNPGKYLLKIIAHGNWKITLEQPTEVSGESLPQTFRGRDNNKVFGPVKLKRGLATVNCIHEGEGLFGVDLYESNGEEEIHIINTFEPYYKGTHLAKVENSGIYYVHIFGNNDWTVKIMQVVTPEPTPEITQAPTQSPSPSATPTLLPATSTSVPTTSPPVTATPTPEEGVPGFESLFAIVGLLAVTYLLRRRM